MNYRARDLPAWVRFRAKPKPLPVYTVPTQWEHAMARLFAHWETDMLDEWKRDRAFLDGTHWAQPGGKIGVGLRIQLPSGYATGAE